MPEHIPNLLEQLAREPVSPQELRTLLERLGSQELGGPEEPDVRAVSEATGVPVEAIGRILADIRRKELHDRYGRDIERHERDIRRLELTTDQIARRIPSAAGFDPELAREIEAVAQGRIRERYTSPWLFLVLPLLVATVIAVGVGTLAERAHPGSTPGSVSTPDSASTRLPSGSEVYVDRSGNAWVIDPDGTRRRPRKDEESAVLMLWSSFARPGNPRR